MLISLFSRRSILRVAALLIGTASAATTAHAATIFVSNPTFDTTRTDTYDSAGFGFHIPATGAAPVVNELGFYVDPSDSAGTGKLAVSHVVALYDYNGATWTELAQATIAAGSTADSTGFAWTSLSTPLSLTDTKQVPDEYILVSSFQSDLWGPSTGSSHHVDNSYFGTVDHGIAVSQTVPIAGVGSTVSATNGGSNGGWIGPDMGLTPEPASLGLLGLSLIPLMLRRRRIAC